MISISVFNEDKADESEHYQNGAGDHQPMRILDLGKHIQIDAIFFILLSSNRVQ